MWRRGWYQRSNQTNIIFEFDTNKRRKYDGVVVRSCVPSKTLLYVPPKGDVVLDLWSTRRRLN